MSHSIQFHRATARMCVSVHHTYRYFALNWQITETNAISSRLMREIEVTLMINNEYCAQFDMEPGKIALYFYVILTICKCFRAER